MKIQSKVFRLAHSIKKHFKTWSETLRAAWCIVKLTLGRVTTLRFLKKSTNTVRVSTNFTIHLKTLKNGCIGFSEINKEGKRQYRSFRVENIITG